MIKIADGHKKCLNNIERMYDSQHVYILFPLVKRQANCSILILNHHILRRLHHILSLEIQHQLAFQVLLSQFVLEDLEAVVLEVFVWGFDVAEPFTFEYFCFGFYYLDPLLSGAQEVGTED